MNLFWASYFISAVYVCWVLVFTKRHNKLGAYFIADGIVKDKDLGNVSARVYLLYLVISLIPLVNVALLTLFVINNTVYRVVWYMITHKTFYDYQTELKYALAELEREVDHFRESEKRHSEILEKFNNHKQGIS